MATRKVDIRDLHNAVAAVCPIDGVDSGGGIQFRDEATPGQRKAAQQVVESWDREAEVQREETTKEKLARLEQEITNLKSRR